MLFKKNSGITKTNWERYHTHPYPFSQITRHILASHITKRLKKYLPRQKDLKIAELGGANSFMYPILSNIFVTTEYHIIDNYPSKRNWLKEKPLHFHDNDVLNLGTMPLMDLTLSIGLIEHFLPEDTKKVIQTHLDLLRPGSIALITFPTPTWLYQTMRFFSTLLGAWIFHDERALTAREVTSIASRSGTVLSCDIIWSTIFTQTVLVVSKN